VLDGIHRILSARWLNVVNEFVYNLAVWKMDGLYIDVNDTRVTSFSQRMVGIDNIHRSWRVALVAFLKL
jgi:hypothetical protein